MEHPDKHCVNCYYYQGASESDLCCCYIFIEDQKRPCPPGKLCTVMKPRKSKRRTRLDLHEERKGENE